MVDLKHIQHDQCAVQDYWRTHGLHTLSGQAYGRRRSREIYTHTWLAIIRACIELGELRPGQEVLEVGCGWGRIIVGLKKLLPGLRVHGVDLVYELVQHAQAVVPAETGASDVWLSAGDAQQPPFETASFDAVVSARVLQYVPNPRQALKEIARVVRPGGRVVIFLPNKLNPARWLRYPARLYAAYEIRDWFAAAGLEAIESRSVCFLPSGFQLEHRSPLIWLEELQRIPLLKHLGGLAAVSARKPAV